MHSVITRKLEFDAGHRVLGHGGKCRHIHGHRYVAEISVRASELNDLGMVIDFSKVKQLVGGWIDEWWDHNIILHPHDPLLTVEQTTATGGVVADIETYNGGKAPYVMSLPENMPTKFANPTAENMARELFNVADILLSKEGVQVTHVRLYETPNSWADYPCEL